MPTLTGHSSGAAQATGQLTIPRFPVVLQGQSIGTSQVSGQLAVARTWITSISPEHLMPYEVLTVTGTVLGRVMSVVIQFPDGSSTTVQSASFLVQNATTIEFVLPPHPTNPLYQGQATLELVDPISGTPQFVYNNLYKIRPFLVSFVGGPLDAEYQMMADIALDRPLQIYSNYGVSRSGGYGRSIWSSYTYASTDTTMSDPIFTTIDPNSVAAHYIFDFILRSVGEHPEGVGRAIQQAPLPPVIQDIPVPTLAAVSPPQQTAGTVVAVSGTGLYQLSGLMIGSITMGRSAFTSATDAQINFAVPAMPSGSYSVVGQYADQTTNAVPFVVV